MQNATQTLPVIIKASQLLHYPPREKNCLTYLGQDTLSHFEGKECPFQNLLQYSFSLSGS